MFPRPSSHCRWRKALKGHWDCNLSNPDSKEFAINIFLTSAGFDNKRIRQLFVQTARSDRENSKVIFVPTAAITAGGKEMLPFCRQEIMESGILEINITEVEISEIASIKNLNDYCAIYVAGGDTQYLVEEMNRWDFKTILDRYLVAGGVYLGVSAGSIALTNSFQGCLGFMNCKLQVHCKSGTRSGKISREEFSEISLTDDQAIIFRDDETEIFG